MIGYFLTTLATALALLIVDLIVPGVNLTSFPVALLAGVAIGLVNSTAKPILFILTLPVTILTLGLFSLVVNGICFWLASLLVPGFDVHGFLAFILGPIVLSLASTVINNYFGAKGTAATLAGDATQLEKTNS